MPRPPIDTLMDQIIAIYGDDPNEWDEDEFIEVDELVGFDEFQYEVNRNG